MTDRKRVEETLRFHAQLLDAVGQAVIATDHRGTITYWNRAAEALYGWTAADMLGRPVGDKITMPAARAQGDEIMAHLHRGETWTGEFVLQRRDGSAVSVLVTDTPIRDDNGAVIGIIGVSTDITARKQAEAALRQSDMTFRALFHNSPEPMCVYDLETLRFLEVNETAVAHYGYTREEILGMSIVDIYAPEEHERLRERLCRHVPAPCLAQESGAIASRMGG